VIQGFSAGQRLAIAEAVTLQLRDFSVANDSTDIPGICWRRISL
jgi:hypothetical protein